MDVEAETKVEEVLVAPEDRLDRIEVKLDALIDAMTSLVRLEEKFAAHEESHRNAMERYGFRLDDLEQRVEAIEKVMPLVNLLLKGTGKVGLALITGVALAIVGLVMVV